MENKTLYDWDNVTIVPAILSDVESRKNVNILIDDKLPLFIAPMDMVIDETNSKIFKDLGFEVCLPRGKNDSSSDSFISYGLSEIIKLMEMNIELPRRVLIDVANGHMKLLYDTAAKIKKEYPKTELMIGNIANPKTFKEYCKLGVDYVRCGIGGGSGCTTSANSAIHYPMASLIRECYEIRRTIDNCNTKIVADGGFQKFADIIKAIALGSDYVMLGGVINKSLESSSPCYRKVASGNDPYVYEEISLEIAKECMDHQGFKIYKYFRGMSTKEVQRAWGNETLKTAEGITKYNEVEYSIDKWVENFSDYLKSNMSYSNFTEISKYKGNADFRFITNEAFKRFNK